MNIPLSTFSAPLLRLILCGGEGLPPAWGPLVQGADAWAWIPTFGRVASSDRHAYPYGGRDLLSSPEAWSLPLDADSPWPARLAMVAKHILDPFTARSLGAVVEAGRRHYNGTESIVEMRLFRWDEPYLLRWLQDGACQFTRDQGRTWIGRFDLNLPTIPHHLQTHPPAVALLLALYDVPEIRARVESA